MSTPMPAAHAATGRARGGRRRGAARPPLRLIHHMARSGGTLISKCLGCMAGVVLLSEIHPLGTSHFNPLIQAQRWYGLLSTQDLIELKARGRVGFVDAIELIRRRAEDCSQRLVIRDWSHLDFTGVPFVARPAHRLLTAEALASALRAASGLHRAPSARPVAEPEPARGGARAGSASPPSSPATGASPRSRRASASIATRTSPRDPAGGDEGRSAQLQLKFDRGFAERWRDYTFVTGDVSGSRGGGEIRPVPRRPVAPDLLATLAANDDYQASLELLGYQHPDA